MTDTKTTARKLFRVLGTTDEVTSCDYCGRVELKGTVKLAILDEDSNDTGELVYYGSGCAAKAGKRKVKDIRDEAKAADAAAREAEWAARQEKGRQFSAARDAWVAENVGPDAMDHPRRYGYSSTVMLVDAFMEATGTPWV
jgi:hypothetical protein